MLPKSIQIVHYIPDTQLLFAHKLHECFSNLWSLWLSRWFSNREKNKWTKFASMYENNQVNKNWIFCIFYSRDLIWKNLKVNKNISFECSFIAQNPYQTIFRARNNLKFSRFLKTIPPLARQNEFSSQTQMLQFTWICKLRKMGKFLVGGSEPPPPYSH